MSSQNLLSEREKQVAGFLLQGKSNKEIASSLGISIRTVEFHATRIYAKLGVSSRVEAIVKLLEEDLRKTAGEKDADLGVSPVAAQNISSLNKGKSTSNLWRIVMRKSFYVLLGVFAVILILLPLFIKGSEQTGEEPVTRQTAENITFPAGETPFPTVNVQSSPTPSGMEKIFSEILLLAGQYEQAVQNEIISGEVEPDNNGQSGQIVLRFSGESAERVLQLYDDLLEQISDLNRRYLALYQAKKRPTPYPTRTTESETEIYHQQLVEEYQIFVEQLLVEGPVIEVYDPVQGIYVKWLVGEAYARSESMFEAMYNLSLAAQMDGINEVYQKNIIRESWGNHDLALEFSGIRPLANAPGFRAVLYQDEAGNTYSVELESDLLVMVEPGQIPDVQAVEVIPLEEARLLAEEFARQISPRFSEMFSGLNFSEGGKGDMYFFDWRCSFEDWAGTSWELMPPFLQIGMLADGQIVTYINTLELAE